METMKILIMSTAVLFGSCSKDTSQSDLLNHKQEKHKINSMELKKPGQDSSSKYYLKFNTDLNELRSGENLNLSFSVKDKEDETRIVKLETVHEKKAHIIIVSDDLEYFNHIHPTQENEGKYSFQMKFPFGGKYKLFVEYQPAGSGKITDGFDVDAEGDAKSKMQYNKEKLSFSEKDLFVKLLNTTEIKSDADSHLPVKIIKDGINISTNKLDNYLGEKAHAIMIGLADKKLLHVHPMVINDMLYLHLNFSGSGFYRLWVQFQLDGTLYTTDFILDVKPLHNSEKKSIKNQHTNH
jgi:hypothetical protein